MTKKTKNNISNSKNSAIFLEKYNKNTAIDDLQKYRSKNEKLSVLDFVANVTNPDIRNMLVSIFKKNEETKIKSLKLLKNTLETLDDTELIGIMPVWVYIYKSLALNINFTIDKLVQEINIFLSAKNYIYEPYVYKLFVPWFLSSHYSDSACFNTVNYSFENYHLKYSCNNEIFDNYLKNTVNFLKEFLIKAYKSDKINTTLPINCACLESSIYICIKYKNDELQNILCSSELLNLFLRNFDIKYLSKLYQLLLKESVLNNDNLKSLTKTVCNYLHSLEDSNKYKNCLDLIEFFIIYNTKFIFDWNLSKTFWMKINKNIMSCSPFSHSTYKWLLKVYDVLHFDNVNFHLIIYNSTIKFINEKQFDYIEPFDLFIKSCFGLLSSKDHESFKCESIFGLFFQFCKSKEFMNMQVIQLFKTMIGNIDNCNLESKITLKETLIKSIKENFKTFIDQNCELVNQSEIICWFKFLQNLIIYLIDDVNFIEYCLNKIRLSLNNPDMILLNGILVFENHKSHNIKINTLFIPKLISYFNDENSTDTFYCFCYFFDYIIHIQKDFTYENISLKLLIEYCDYLIINKYFDLCDKIISSILERVLLENNLPDIKKIINLVTANSLIKSSMAFVDIIKLKNVLNKESIDYLLQYVELNKLFKESAIDVSNVLVSESMRFSNLYEFINLSNIPLFAQSIVNYVKDSSTICYNSTVQQNILSFRSLKYVHDYINSNVDILEFINIDSAIDNQRQNCCFLDVYHKFSLFPPSIEYKNVDDAKIRNYLRFIHLILTDENLCIILNQNEKFLNFIHKYICLYLLTDKINARIFISKTRIRLFDSFNPIPSNEISENSIILFYEASKYFNQDIEDRVMDYIADSVSEFSTDSNITSGHYKINMILVMLGCLKNINYISLSFQLSIGNTNDKCLIELNIFNTLLSNFLTQVEKSESCKELINDICNISNIILVKVSNILSKNIGLTELISLLTFIRNSLTFKISLSNSIIPDNVIQNIIAKSLEIMSKPICKLDYMICIREIQNIYHLLFSKNLNYGLDQIIIDFTKYSTVDINSYTSLHIIVVEVVKNIQRSLLLYYKNSIDFLFLNIVLFPSVITNFDFELNYSKKILNLINSSNINEIFKYYTYLLYDQNFIILSKIDENLENQYELDSFYCNALNEQINLNINLNLSTYSFDFCSDITYQINSTLKLLLLSNLLLKRLYSFEQLELSIIIENEYIKNIITRLLSKFIMILLSFKDVRQFVPTIYFYTTNISSLAGFIYNILLKYLFIFPRILYDIIKANPRYANDIKKFTNIHISRHSIDDNITACINRFKDDSNLLIVPKVGLDQLDIKFLYKDDEINIHISYPQSFPIRPIQVEPAKIETKKSITYMQDIYRLQLIILSQRGSLCHALEIWKQNNIKRFDGLDPCSICYAIIENLGSSMPTEECCVCHKKVHKSCLIKWFKSSLKKNCPNCRSNFY